MFWKLFFIILISAFVSLIDKIYFNYYAINYFNSLFSEHFYAGQNLDRDMFSVEELEKYNGIDKPELYLSLLGNMFDVTKGRQYYGPGETYNYFIGRDASRGFITGKLEDDNNDHVADLKADQLRSLKNWLKFYHKEYTKVGKLIGKYYTKDGKLTPYGKQIKKLIKAAEKTKVYEELEKQKFPPCNVEWDAEKGTRVWCTDRSGGIERNWIGKPRKLWVPGSNNYRCACIQKENEELANVKEYDGCDSSSDSCFLQEENL